MRICSSEQYRTELRVSSMTYWPFYTYSCIWLFRVHIYSLFYTIFPVSYSRSCRCSDCPIIWTERDDSESPMFVEIDSSSSAWR